MTAPLIVDAAWTAITAIAVALISGPLVLVLRSRMSKVEETQQDVGAKQTELTGVIVDLAARVKTLEDESGRMKTWIQAAVPWMRRAHHRLLELDPTWSDEPPDEPKL